jgi:hypothetical protein
MSRHTGRVLPALVLPLLLAPAALGAQGGDVHPGFRPDCTPLDSAACWRSHEEQFLARWPDAAERRGDTLIIALDDWGRFTVVDRPPPGDQTRMWAFRGVLERLGLVLVDELRYLGHDLWLIDPRSGVPQQLPCWIVPSSYDLHLFCGEGTWDEMGPSGSAAIYEMVGDSAVLRTRQALGPYQPVGVSWDGLNRVEFQRRPIDRHNGTPPGCTSAFEKVDGEWTYTECVR